jgi:nucleoside-diphosphate-sugar epimerase
VHLALQSHLLITGGCGVIGTILKPFLEDKYTITCLDTRLSGSECVIGDVTKLDDIEPFFENKDIVIHLAANSSLEADWDSVYKVNVLGTYNVFEASRKQKIKKLIFASSNHVTGLYEGDWPISAIVKGDFQKLYPNEIPKISHMQIPKPDSLYGVSKLFGEGLGQYFCSQYGISVICLRIGTVRPYEWPKPSETRFFATWLSHRDLAQLVEKSIEADSVEYDVFYGVSNNRWRFWDISHSEKILGYRPQDDAENYRPGV